MCVCGKSVATGGTNLNIAQTIIAHARLQLQRQYVAWHDFEMCLCTCLLRHSIMPVIMLQLRECLAKLQDSCKLMVELMAAVDVAPVYYINLAHLIRNLVTKVTHTVSHTG
jgi:hypothetical protein